MSHTLYNNSELQMESQLILCIEELDYTDPRNIVDICLFIGWDNTTETYFVRGKRQDTSRTYFVPFAFQCYSSHELYDFIEFCVNYEDGIINVNLYNFNNIKSVAKEDLTYEFFEEHEDSDYLIAGYDEFKTNRKYMLKILKMLRNIEPV
jgi:hypothetical protein